MTDIHISGLSALAPGAQFVWGGGQAIDAGLLRLDPAHAADDWFDARQHLAGVKHRYLNDSTRYSIAASSACLRQPAADAWHRCAEEQRGIIVGTAVADYAVRHLADQQVISGGPALLNTVSAPNISANIAAAWVAIACRGRAFATTMTSPFLAGFESLFLAAQSLQAGRSAAVLAIATEEALPDEDTSSELPGAVVVQLQAGPAPGARRIVASAWAARADAPHRLSRSTQRFLTALTQQSAACDTLQLLVLRDDSAAAAATAGCWGDWLYECGVRPRQTVERVFDGQGTVAPMLWAASWLTQEQPVLLLAIQQRRHLAFLVTP